MTIKKATRVFGIGDLVDVPVGTHTLKGKVAEDRGEIGVRGRKLYRIVVMIDGDAMNVELPADQIRLSVGRVAGKKVRNAPSLLKKVTKPENV